MKTVVSSRRWTDTQPAPSIPLTPGPLRRRVAFGVMPDTAGDIWMVKGELVFLKSGQPVAKVGVAFGVQIFSDTATSKECLSLAHSSSNGDGWNPVTYFNPATAGGTSNLAPYVFGGGNLVLLSNDVLAEPLDCGEVDADALACQVTVTCASPVGAAQTAVSVLSL